MSGVRSAAKVLRWPRRKLWSAAVHRHPIRWHRPAVERLEERWVLAAGDLDTSFGPDGTGMAVYDPIPAYTDEMAGRVAIQADGKIVTAWTTGFGNDINEPLPLAGVARFTVDGLPDPNFGGSGILPPGFTAMGGGIEAWARDVAIQPDGKIVLVAAADDDMDVRGFLVARFNQDGSIDSNFGNEFSSIPGVAIVPFLTTTTPEAAGVVIQADGRIVVAGNSRIGRIGLGRLFANGGLDNSFGFGGVRETSFGGGGVDSLEGFKVNDVALQQDGRIVVVGKGGITTGGGWFSQGFSTEVFFAAARYDSDGDLDDTFDGNGLLKIPAGDDGPGATSVAIQPDGKIVLGGEYVNGGDAFNDSQSWFMLARIHPVDGSPDASFGGNDGVVRFGEDAFGDSTLDAPSQIAVMPNGRIVAASSIGFGGELAVARFHSNGELDSRFGTGGVATADFGDFSDAFGVGIQPSGKIVAAGTVEYQIGDFQKGNHVALARFDNSMLTRIGNFVFEMTGPVLVATGSPGNDSLMVIEKGLGQYEFSTADGRERATVNGVVRVEVQGLGGDDVVTYQRGPDHDATNDLDVNEPNGPIGPADPLFGYDGGEGNDELTIRLAPGIRIGVPGQPVLATCKCINYDGGPGERDKLILETGSGRQIVHVNGDVEEREEPDPYFDVYDELTGLRTEAFTSGVEFDTVDLGEGPDELFVHWDPEQFVDVGRFTGIGGTGDDVILFLFDQAFATTGRTEIVVTGNEGNDSVGAQFEHPAAAVIFNPQPDPPREMLMTINGGPGDDQVDLRHSAPAWFQVSATVDMGAGADAVLLDWDGQTLSETGIPPSELSAFSGRVSVKLGSGENQFQFNGKGSFETFSVGATGGIQGDEALFSLHDTTVTESLMTSFDGSNGTNSAQWDVDGLSVNSQFIAAYRGLNGSDHVGIIVDNGTFGADALFVQKVDVGNGNNVVSVHNEGIDQRGGRSLSKIVGGNGMDEVGIIVIGGKVGLDAMQSWEVNTENNTNGVSFETEDFVVDGKFVAKIRDGVGAGNVDIYFCGELGAEGVVSVLTDLGNGDNTASVFASLMNQGRATFKTEGGTGADTISTMMGAGADEVGEIIDNGHVAFITEPGNGSNRYSHRSEDVVYLGSAEVTVRGGTGQDAMMAEFVGGEVRSGATLRVSMTDSQGMNTQRAAAVDVLMNGDLRFALTGGRHNDGLTIDARLDPRSAGRITGSVRGGAADDHLIFDVLGSDLVEGLVDGGPGVDTCLAHQKVKVVNCER